MTTIHDAYINALLADATYALSANRSYLGGDLKDALSTRMTTTLANFIGNNFSAVTHIDSSDNPLFGTGFDATVWRGNANTEFADKTYVSFTGSEALADFVSADFDLTVSGAANRQIEDMVNWWLKNTTADNTPAQQILWNGYSFENNGTVPGTGIITGRSNIIVDGHSLGGHLATAFTRLFGGQSGWSIDHTYTYNSAGFTASSDVIFKQIEALLGAGVSKGYFEGVVGQTNFFAENGINVTTNTLYNDQLGLRTSVFNEESSFLNSLSAPNHYMYKLTDALVLGDAIAKLDTTFTIEKMSALFDKGANETEASLEGVLDSLRKTLLGSVVTLTPIGDVDKSALSRATFHENLAALLALDSSGQPTGIFAALAGKVTLVAPPTSSTEARTDLGAFLSLFYLTPFALKVEDAGARDLLYAVHQSLADKWNDDRNLTAEQIANGEANFSDMYLADRAAMLTWKIKLNKEDFANPNNGFGYQSGTQGQHFEDAGTGTSIDINKQLSNLRNFKFGSGTTTDTLAGGDNDDHLYGMGGDDTLNGGKGNDWLEGGANADTLNGDEGTDTLYGGTGDDTLTGGTGTDYLYGGKDEDKYIHNDGDGNDVILDSDGLGSIQVKAGATLDGGDKVTGSDYVWQSADKQTRYTKYDQGDGLYTLNILLANGEKIYVKDWQDGNLGINLQGGGTPTAPPVLSNASDMYFAKDADEKIDGGDGNDLIFAIAREKFTLKGGVGNDLILGYSNDRPLILFADNPDGSGSYNSVALYPISATDHTSEEWQTIHGEWHIDSSVGSNQHYYLDDSAYVGTYWTLTGIDPVYGSVSIHGPQLDYTLYTYTTASADAPPQDDVTELLYGDAGDDLISGSMDADYIDGGNDNDLLYGNSGNDFMFGGQGIDFAFGGDGNDLIDGGTEADELVGGYGNDAIYGGAGNDDLTGDLLALQGTDPLAPPASTDFSLMGDDMLDGGAGNDKLWGGGGADMLLGGEDDDELVGDGIGTPSDYEGVDILDGGAGNDKLWGNGKGDVLYGGSGSDTIEGDSSNIPDADHGDDYIDGGTGNDYLIGQGGKDTLYGGEGDDTLFGDSDQVSIAFHGDDYLDGGDGNDELQGGDSNDTLMGGAGDDVLFGENGNDALNGGSGDDQLIGGDGDDTLDGGAGSDGLWGDAGNDTLIGTGGLKGADGVYTGGDALYGGEGDDIYYAQAGDVIDDTQGNNVINASVGASDLQLAGSTLAIGSANGDYIFIQNGLTAGENNVYQLGGSAINQADLIENGLATAVNLTTSTQFVVGGTQNDTLIAGTTISTVLRGGGGNDNLMGNAGNDMLNGGAGDDTLVGGTGDDVYQVDSIGDAVVESVDAGVDAVESSITYALSNQVENLTLMGLATINGSGNELNNVLAGNDAANTLDGGFGNDIIEGFAGNDVLEGGVGDDNLQGAEGNDVLNGGAGDDMMAGGTGDDVYTLSVGDGFDSIEDTQGLNQITFGAGVTRESIHASQYQGDDGSYYLRVQYGSGADSVAIKDGLAGGIQSYHFEDGTQISHADLIGAEGVPFHVYGTQNADTLFGANNADTLEGKAGDDQLLGLDGDDTLLGGGGADTLVGGLGNDFLDGGLGNDQLEGGAGQDGYLMRWGMGQDVVIDGSDGGLNTIKLGMGINFADLVAQRNADDLFLHFKGGEEGLLIKNYYFGGQQWDISTDSGDVITVQNFIDNSSVNNQTWVEQEISNYEARVRTLYYSTLGQDGYTLGAGGLLSKTENEISDQYAHTFNYVNEFAITSLLSDESIISTTTNPVEVVDTELSHEITTVRIFGGKGNGNSINVGNGAQFHDYATNDNGGFQIPQGSTFTLTQSGVWLHTSGYGSASSNGFSYTYPFVTISYQDYLKLSLQEIQAGSSDNDIGAYGYAVVDGGSGDDTIHSDGGFGWGRNYYEYSRYFNPYYLDSARNIGALLYGNEGDDKIFGSNANDVLIGGSGSDFIDGGDGADTYLIYAGESGNDIITDSGHLALIFNPDSPHQKYTNDYIDWYYQSLGIDDWQSRYFGMDGFAQGEGLPILPTTSLTDYAALAPFYATGAIKKDTVEFGVGIALADMRFSWGQTVLTSTSNQWSNDSFKATLDISWGQDSGVSIAIPLGYINGVDANSSVWYLGAGIEQFKFADGTLLSMAQMVSLAPLMPTVAPILFDVGSGQVSVSYLWKNLVQMGSNILPTDVNASRDGVDLLITHDNGVDQLRIQNWYQNPTSLPVINVTFADGTVWSADALSQGLVVTGGSTDDIMVGMNGVNNFLYGKGGNDTITAGDTGDHIYGGASNDRIDGGDGDDYLVGGTGNDLINGGNGSDYYEFQLGGGHDQVDNAATDNATATDSINFGNEDIAPADIVLSRVSDDLLITVNASDSITIKNYYVGIDNKIDQILFNNGTIWDRATFEAMVSVVNVNHDPVVANAIATQTALEDNLFTFTVPDDAFSDIDVGDTLSYTTTLADGSALPSWLTFDAVTRTFSGTPLNDNVGNLNLKLTATDLAGASVSQTFDLSVQNTNDAPVLSTVLADAIATETQTFSYTIPTNTFADVDVGDTLSYTVTLANGTALPTWLSFDTATNTISGTALDANIGTLDLLVTATDIAGATSQDNFLLTINPLDRVLIGTTGNDTLIGGQGNDIIDGGAGVDTMKGGKGNDTYVVDLATDVVTETSNEGIDTIQSSVTLTSLAANVENLILTGITAINGTGNTLNNVITGNVANNTLNGGTGADTMQGGLGNDIYVVDNVGDSVIENAGEGTDTVQSSISYTLGAELENLTLTSTAAINGTGNDLNNSIVGNIAVNILTGGIGNDTLNGGASADTLVGSLGNDIYVVDNAGDTVIESANEGTDTVQSSISYTLGSNLENLTLIGTAAINGTGNDLNNSIIGNTAVNILTGGIGNDTLNGGVAADTLIGSLGNDIYVVDNLDDVVIENAGEGTDTVQTAITLGSLAANVENLTLTGTLAINGTGNALDNVLTGNAAINTLTGSLGNDTLNGVAGADTLIGGLGDDTYVVDNVGDIVTENLDEGIDCIQTSITLASLTANVENLTLTGASAINATGNELNNTLTGNAAANILNGGLGADMMIGGLGNDTYVVDDAGDMVIETSTLATEIDTVQSGISYTLGANVEKLILTGVANINATGNELNNTLTGNAGNNILDGGLGNDTMLGGLGDDTYIVDATTDIVTEAASAGIDTVQSSAVTYTLAANLENLILTGADNINGTGNKLSNIIIGNAGDNTLSGGTGADTMAGNLGNDTYIVDNVGDGVTENLNEGIDTVQSSITYTLTANVENLILSGAGAINATGNELNNTLTGNAAANILNGGLGADTLTGGLGNDTYVVDDIGDIVIETSTIATELDTVQSSISYTLGANLEKLILTGVANINATGNELNNTLTGNAGNNILDGGLGNDTMAGGLGDDTYIVDATTDIVTEAASAGTDTVQSSVATYTLSSNLENLSLTGSDNINGTGNTLNNIIIGNAGDNRLSGGTGADTMAGNLGNDTYIVDNVGDVVTENFNEGTDAVQSTVTYTLGNHLENLTLTGAAAINGTGNALSNFMMGNAANNILTDTAGGNDILQGFAGIDTLNDTAGNNLFDGGLGNDIITAGTGNDLLLGGLGNDTITTGTGYDVIVFNKGDGLDTINASIGADNTLSLGGNFAYSDLSLTKSTNNLVLKMGTTDQVTLKDWYLGTTNKSVVNLQVIAEAMQGFSLGSADALRNNKIENFNFADIVTEFDAAGATANWQLTDARLTAHLQAGSDIAAIGGDLAYQYGKNSNLTGMGSLNAQSVISAANFGQSAQAVNDPSVWQAELVKLG